jgi:hypothetical protein
MVGAALTPEQVIGRDELVDRYWSSLEGGHSLLLLAPRRMGKTSVCTLLRARARSGFVVCSMDVEHCGSGRDFVAQTGKMANEGLERGRLHLLETLPAEAARVLKRIKLGQLAVEVETEPPLGEALARLLGKLEVSCREAGLRLVLLWDELPLFIDKLSKRGDHGEAITLLDGLRGHRQEHAGGSLRMVYTGSIGMFEVLDRLRVRTGYGGKPANDMKLEHVPLLDPEQARALVAALLWDMGRPGARERRFVEHVAACGEGHPYVTQWLASELWLVPPSDPLDAGDVDRLLDRLVGGDDDPLDLEHYVQRLDDLGWGQDARAILDVLAPRGDLGATVNELDNVLSGLDRTRIADVLKRLRRDGYLTGGDGVHRFRLQLLARWWVQRHGLER